MNTPPLLELVKKFVSQLFTNADTSSLLYHTIRHTEQVVKHAQEIADHYKLSTHSNFVVLSAAWFHDTGMLSGDITGHEERSVKIMEDFFTDKNIDTTIVSTIAQIILATKTTVVPVTQLEKILCDADTWYAGTTDFHRLDTLLWSEYELKTNHPVKNQISKSLQFLQSHQFYTDYCIRQLSEGKKKNIELLEAFFLGESATVTGKKEYNN